MTHSLDSIRPRRQFITRIAATIAALSAGLPGIAHAANTADGDMNEANQDEWMKSLKGKHRQFFHATGAADAPMLMANNYLDAYRDSYDAKPGEVNAVIGVHSAALAIGFNDAAWAKYGMGKANNVIDPATKEPAIRNIFATGGNLSVESGQKRGIVFLMCNTALRLRSRMMAAERGETPEALYADLSASRLPGTILVPAMVVTINRAQEKGFTYIKV